MTWLTPGHRGIGHGRPVVERTLEERKDQVLAVSAHLGSKTADLTKDDVDPMLCDHGELLNARGIARSEPWRS
jgi:hypothetical protein